MRKFSTLILTVITVLSGSLAHPEDGLGPARHADHEQAIALARSGDLVESLRLLGELRAEYPDSRPLLYDETVVLTWAGEDTRAIANAEGLDPASAPDYVLDAIAKALRNTGRYDDAAIWYAALLDRDKYNLEARLGLVFSHADAGNALQAHRTLEATPADQRDEPRLTLAEAHVLEREGRQIDALSRYQHVLELDPGNRAALRGMALLLRELLLPRLALSIAERHAGLMSDTEIAQLEVDVAAVEIRQGAETTYPTARRYEGTDQALSRIDTLLSRPNIHPDARRRLELDRIVALTDRRRTAEAVVAFETLDQPLAELPVYLLNSVGTAYLDEHRPEQAREILEHATHRAPDHLEIRFQLFFAYTDLQQHDKARTLTGELLSRTRQMYRASPEATREAETYLRATILAGLARSYADQLAESQQYFEALLAEMPHNTQIRHELANVYRWRGWTDRSLSQYAQILAVEPDFLAARIANTHTLLDAREYELAEYEMAWLEENYGEETAVQNLAHRWRLHNRSELQLDARFGESSGVTFGEDQYEVDTTWYSRPFANRYRALVRTHDAFAEFPEGESHRRRASAGVEYRYRRWQADAAVSVARSGGDSGLGVGVDYRFSDVLSLGGRVETESNATPLRGYRIGISSNLASVTARYAWHESTAIGATLSAQNLSDGNSVRSWLLLGEQRLLNRPRYKITLIADLYGSERERDDVAYFSPTSDFSWTSGLRVDWSVYRRFRFDVSQSLSAQVGQYNQAGYSAGGTWSAEYRLSVAMGERWYANIGALRLRRFFDGLAEYATFVVAGFSGRF